MKLKYMKSKWMHKSGNWGQTACVKQTGWGGETRHQRVDVGGWSWAYQGGRYLACCWNLLPPTGNYRAVSIPVTTAVPGLPADRPWFNTQIPPHTHVMQAMVPSLTHVEERGLSWEWSIKFTHCSLKNVLFWLHEQFSDNPPETMQAVLIGK